ncbi:hypothetical protein B0T22DRAFT_126016 [Podospora appendiculata]|uniref:Uncharacterized protein n=1 Tax=Podospora appendiculata TaxID=314037 RepID=A0AAE0X7A6_9PEZI|nr:hypothetical protein B0T22DRAFT_126016 [Podospora appendiculata]
MAAESPWFYCVRRIIWIIWVIAATTIITAHQISISIAPVARRLVRMSVTERVEVAARSDHHPTCPSGFRRTECRLRNLWPLLNLAGPPALSVPRSAPGVAVSDGEIQVTYGHGMIGDHLFIYQRDGLPRACWHPRDCLVANLARHVTVFPEN